MKTLFTIVALSVATALSAQNNPMPGTFPAEQVNTITNFRAENKNKGVELNWRALHGNDISRYDLQKSTLGSNFRTVGSVVANELTPAKYNYYDASPIYGKNYYRLIAVENDGNRTYSKIIMADNGTTETQMMVFPNPVVNGNLNVQFYNFDQGRYNISLLSNSGTRVLARSLTFPFGRSTQQISLPRYLPSGTYFLQVTNGKTNFTKQVLVR